jgi:hypothetical protein
MGKDLVRSDHGLIEISFHNLPGGTDENHKKPQSGQLASQPIIKLNTCKT